MRLGSRFSRLEKDFGGRAAMVTLKFLDADLATPNDHSELVQTFELNLNDSPDWTDRRMPSTGVGQPR